MKYLQPQGRQKNLNLIPIAGTTTGAATGAGLRAKHRLRNQGCDTQQDVSLMESEEANGGGPIPSATSSPSEESPDPTPAKRGHHATTESVEMSTELPGSAEGAQISIGQGPLSPLSAGESAEMCGRSSNPVPAGLEQGVRDLRQQRGLSEWETDPAVEETPLEKERRVHSLNSDQGNLVHPESSQYSSLPNTVSQAPITHDKSPQVQSAALHMEFPQDQEDFQACHAAVSQAKHKETSMTDTVPSQREPATNHFLVCKEVSEVHGQTETLQDETAGDPPLQGLDVANVTISELLPRTEAAAGTNKEPSPGMDAVGTMNPILSVDNDEKTGGLQGEREDTDSSSSPSHHPPHPLSDDSQGNARPPGGNADRKKVLSSHERENNALATDQKTDVAGRQSPSGSINLLAEEKKGRDDGGAEGSTESPSECVFQIQNAAKNTEQEGWQRKQREWEEEPGEEEQSEKKQTEQGEPEWQKLEKEVKPVQEEPVSEREDQKEKRWDDLEQEPEREEEGLEASPQALGPGSPSLSTDNRALHDVRESISLAEGTGLASLPQESFPKAQHPGEDVLSSTVSKACTGGESVIAQPPVLITSESLHPVGGSSVMHSPTCHFSEHWRDMGVSGPSSCISINGQDCGETNPGERARGSIGEDGRSDRDGRTVQSSDDGEALSLLCSDVTSYPGAGNPDSPRTLDPSFGAENLGSLGPENSHPVAENPVFPIHHDFTPASSSELNSAASAADPSQEDADEGSHVSPVGYTGLDKAPSSVQDVSSQTSPDLQEAVSDEGASVSTSTVDVLTPQGLVPSEKGLNEEPSAQPFISKAFRSPPPTESLPTDTDGVEATPAAPSPQAPDMAPAPPNYPEKVQRHQKPPTGSFVFQGKEMEAHVVHAAQQEPLLEQAHLNFEVEEPGTGSAFNSVAETPEEAVIFPHEQHTQLPPPTPEPTLPLALVPDASQLAQPLDLVPDSNQPPAPAPDIDQPLPSVTNPNPPLDCAPDSSQLLATAPALASVSDADSLVRTLVSAPDVEVRVEKLPLMQVTEEGVTGVQWDPIISFTQDVVDSSDSGVTLLAKSSDFPTLENEAPMGHSDSGPEVTGQHMDTHCGKSPSDHTSWASQGGWRTSTDSESRNSVQPPPVLAFSNPIHFLQVSPPSPPAVRKLYRQVAFFEEPQWEQAEAGPTRVDTRSATSPAVIIETVEGARTCRQRMEMQGEPLPLGVQVKEEVARHAPLEKSSSCPDKIRGDMKPLGLNSGSQENPIKRRAKSKDWHRQGLRKMSALPDSLQEDGAHKDQPVSSDAVTLREKKSADTLESFKRRHSKLINSSRLLYQEYSDVALNKAIQSQKRADILAEDLELSSPSSPRLRRKVLSPQDSYLQRLSVSSNPSLWQDIPKIRGSRILLNMSRDDQKLQEAKFELIMSEASYLRSLNVAVDHFQRSSELQGLLTNQERKWLFSRLQDVRDVSASFLSDLEEKFEEDMFTFNVCDVALRHAPEIRRVYLPYVTNQTYQEQTFQRLISGNARFQQVLERLESHPVCQRLSLKSFLILPFQRITRLKLLLQNILKRTPPESDEEVQATQAYDALEKLIKDCNENVQRMKSTEDLIHLRQKIDFECKIFPLVSQSRRLVKCGELMALDYNALSPKWKVTTRPIYLHLFNDRLLLSRPREGGRFVVFDHAAFSDVRGEKCEMKLHGANKNVFRLFLLQNNQGKRVEFLFRTETHNKKLRWISALAPPQEEPDLLESPDSPQVQCIRTYKARENDELDLEKADIIMVMQNSSDGWMEGVKLSDGERGWFPSEHVELISSKHARQKNLKEEQRVKDAKQQVFCKK
ncbi:rho guanine nucleotide exchange factor 5-like [Emydura macquarii macquarii]|uniref:rho guanine nucleotide exchange factor 5-like n=1 Tax=Emydura macquarii macquarii TaxID=1129001 RepID=UPI00352ACAD4